MPRIEHVGRAVVLLCLGLAAGCGGGSDPSAGGTTSAQLLAAMTCSQLAERYKCLLEADASLCTPGEANACSGRRPVWGVEVSGGAIVSYGISECPASGSGVPVNPDRTAQLDLVLAAYVTSGCDTSAGPGCGTPGTRPAPACVVDGQGAGRCQ
jgi:hypothetical protein